MHFCIAIECTYSEPLKHTIVEFQQISAINISLIILWNDNYYNYSFFVCLFV